MSRLAIPGERATRALREAQAANFPHRGTLYHRTREVDEITGRPTVTFEEGDTLPCRINPAARGGLNIVAGQDAIAGEWIVSFAWNAAALREQDRVLVQQGPDSESEFGEMVEIKRILLPRTAEVVTIVFASTVELP